MLPGIVGHPLRLIRGASCGPLTRCCAADLTIGVEFGARMVTIDKKQIKLQIWDTVPNPPQTLPALQGPPSGLLAGRGWLCRAFSISPFPFVC